MNEQGAEERDKHMHIRRQNGKLTPTHNSKYRSSNTEWYALTTYLKHCPSKVMVPIWMTNWVGWILSEMNILLWKPKHVKNMCIW